EKSKVLLPLTNSAIADGKDSTPFTLSLVDVAGNPVVGIDCSGCPSRKVTVQGRFENQMSYDSIYRTESYPVQVNEAFVDHLGETLAPVDGVTAVTGTYPLSATSFAPTLGGNSLKLTQISAHVQDAELPRLTQQLPKTDAMDETFDIPTPLPSQSLSFQPALIAANAQITTGGMVNQLIDGAQTELSFSLINQSASEPLENMDLDTIFEFYADSGTGGALLKTHAIEPALGIDRILGWLDPIAPIEGAHMEIANGALAHGGPSIDGTNSLFSSAYPLKKDSEGTPAPLRTDGSYDISGVYDIPEAIEDDQFGQIDRSDIIPITLATKATSAPILVRFTPAFQMIPEDMNVSDVNLRINQQIGYRFANQPQFTIYEPATPLLSGLNVNSSGAKFKGIGIGETIFDEKLQVIGEQGIKGLKEQIRRNVAELSLNRTPCSYSNSPTEGLEEDLTLSTSGSCVKVDEKSKTIVALYQGDSSQTLVLGDGGDTAYVPEGYRYTLILKGGLNLFIRSNLAYKNSASSLGIILLGKEGLGANVYVAPEPTNLVGSLFAEGSLLSSPDGETLYYGAGGANSQELKNQLYWQGSIASLNTLGGASRNVLPQGVICPNGLTPYECAQRYDLSFIRRFSVTQAGDGVLNQGLFSGGGTCAEDICIPGSLPSTVTITGGLSGGLIDKTESASLDAFFIEPANRPAPPGFTVTSGQQSIDVIR
ncbi:MAG: hypothetical protein V1908_03065, partial [Candidatus Peregrinibacteria bacterium]